MVGILEILSIIVQSLKAKITRSFNKITSKGFLAFLDSLVAYVYVYLPLKKSILTISLGKVPKKPFTKWPPQPNVKSYNQCIGPTVFYIKEHNWICRPTECMYLSMYYLAKIQIGSQMCRFVSFCVVHTKIDQTWQGVMCRREGNIISHY